MQVNISLEVEDNDSLHTEASLALRKLGGSVEFHHLSRLRRHPLAIYNTSIDTIGTRMLGVLDIIEDAQGVQCFLNREATTWGDSLVEATDSMLDALMEHMDDCGAVLQGLVSPDVNLSRQPAYRAFRDETAEYHKHIGSIVNYIKHQQGRIRLCLAWHGVNYLPGYYIEGPDNQGVLGPVESIHHDGLTAFSYMRDLRFHVIGVYGVGVALAKAIQIIAGRPNETGQTIQPSRGQGALTRVIFKLAKYPVWAFEDEVVKPWPRVGLIQEEGSSKVEIEYPSTGERPIQLDRPTQFSSGSRGDGVSRSFRFPYFPADQ